MIRVQSFLPPASQFLAIASIAALLSGCGAGADSQSVPAADAAAYADTLAYCGSQEPTGAEAQPGGLSITNPWHSGAPMYDVGAVVSPAGAAASVPMHLRIDIHDYRPISGSFILPGYAEPEWKMGVAFSPVLPPKSAACVASLAKLTPVGNTGRYTMAWSSKWSASVPVGDLPGKALDGFEFVGNFTPADAAVYFVVSKTWVASSQGLSICYRAPAGTSWDCAGANVADSGANWSLSRPGAKPGVYVVTVPSAG